MKNSLPKQLLSLSYQVLCKKPISAIQISKGIKMCLDIAVLKKKKSENCFDSSQFANTVEEYTDMEVQVLAQNQATWLEDLSLNIQLFYEH